MAILARKQMWELAFGKDTGMATSVYCCIKKTGGG